MPIPDFEDIKTFAAFGGFLLGAANLGITVYDKFLKRGKALIEVEKASVKLLGRGWYAVQLEISVRSQRTKNWVKSVYIEHSKNVIQIRKKENQTFETTSKVPFLFTFPHGQDDYLDLDQMSFVEKLKDQSIRGAILKDLALDEGEQKSFTLVAELETERLPDETLELPLHGWRLVIDLGQTISSVPFSFKPHHTSPKVLLPQQSKPDGFINN
jgi:hypothetical protein